MSTVVLIRRSCIKAALISLTQMSYVTTFKTALSLFLLVRINPHSSQLALEFLLGPFYSHSFPFFILTDELLQIPLAGNMPTVLLWPVFTTMKENLDI